LLKYQQANFGISISVAKRILETDQISYRLKKLKILVSVSKNDIGRLEIIQLEGNKY